MPLQYVDNFRAIPGVENWIEIIGEAGADQSKLPPLIPAVHKTWQHSNYSFAFSKHEHTQGSAAKMRPPGHQPLWALKRSLWHRSFQKATPFGPKTTKMCGVLDDVNRDQSKPFLRRDRVCRRSSSAMAQLGGQVLRPRKTVLGASQIAVVLLCCFEQFEPPIRSVETASVPEVLHLRGIHWLKPPRDLEILL